MYFAGYHAPRLNLDPALRKYNSVKSAGDDHAIAFDLSFDFGAFSEDHGLLGNNISLDVAVNAKSSFELEGAFQRHTLVDETRPLFIGAIS
jgi:hypothetical protein